MNASMRVFVKELKEDTDFKGIMAAKSASWMLGIDVFIMIALLNILAGAHEFKENLSTQANEQEALKAIDNVIADELEHRFGERFERAVRRIILCSWHDTHYVYIDLAQGSSQGTNSFVCLFPPH